MNPSGFFSIAFCSLDVRCRFLSMTPLVFACGMMLAGAPAALGALDFDPGQIVEGISSGNRIATADLNGDGSTDIVFTKGSNQIGVQFRDATGRIINGYTMTGGGTSFSCVNLSDFDLDGRLDLLATDYTSGRLFLWRGRGNGDFTGERWLQAAPLNRPGLSHVAVADMNGDSLPDFVTGSVVDGIRIVFNRQMRESSWEDTNIKFDSAGGVNSLALLDVDRDGRLDIVWSARTGAPVRAMVSGGSFGAREQTFAGFTSPLEFKYLAVAGTSNGGNVFALIERNPSGTGRMVVGRNLFASNMEHHVLSGFANAGQPCLADLDRDALPDLALVVGSGTNAGRLHVYGGAASGAPFAAAPVFDAPTGTDPTGVSAAQIDADGALDLWVATSAASADFGSARFIPWHNVLNSLVVSTAEDEDDGNSFWTSGSGTSLREALNYAQTLSGPQTITFAPFAAAAGTTIELNSQLHVNHPAGITVAFTHATGGVTLSGRNVNRIFTNEAGSKLSLENLTLSGGQSHGTSGGAVASHTGATLTVRGCTFSGNTAGNGVGGAIWAAGEGEVTIRNCTFTGNTGNTTIAAGGTVRLEHNTVVGNNGQSGNGGVTGLLGSVVLNNNIFSDNSGTDIAFGSGPYSGSNNIIRAGPTAGLTNTINADPLLGPLTANGGPTKTMALTQASPAYNAAISLGSVGSDQRGKGRGTFGASDIGAYEISGLNFAVVPGGTLELGGTLHLRSLSSLPAADYMAVNLGSVPGVSFGQLFRDGAPWGSSGFRASSQWFTRSLIRGVSSLRYVNTSGVPGQTESIPVKP